MCCCVFELPVVHVCDVTVQIVSFIVWFQPDPACLSYLSFFVFCLWGKEPVVHKHDCFSYSIQSLFSSTPMILWCFCCILSCLVVVPSVLACPTPVHFLFPSGLAGDGIMTKRILRETPVMFLSLFCSSSLISLSNLSLVSPPS